MARNKDSHSKKYWKKFFLKSLNRGKKHGTNYFLLVLLSGYGTAVSMVEKEKYIKRFKALYETKNGTTISDEMALEYFEKLVCLVGAVTSHLKVSDVILPKEYGRKQMAKA